MTCQSPSAQFSVRPNDLSRQPAHIALLGNFPPRRCGLATYTHDSWLSLLAHPDQPRVDVYAMDDGQVGGYGSTPHMLIPQDDAQAYVRAAEAINASGAEMVWVQHEFGIFGGRAGAHLLALVDRLAIPFIVTLHTVLDDPTASQRRVMDQLLTQAAGIVVMTEKGRAILEHRYDVARSAITVVSHGVPDRPYMTPAKAKIVLGLDQRPLVLTFGLLSPDKGVMHMIDALPSICQKTPDVHYVVLGATHPHLKARDGETYRNSLIARAQELGVAGNVSFVDRFVELDELLEWLAAADLYVTPYLNPAQIVSGTLSFAVAMGKPIVSTPYSHATELLAGGCGRLVPFASTAGLADAVSELLCDPAARAGLAETAYRLGRGMTWERNADAMMTVISCALDEARSPAVAVSRLQALPRTKLDPILRMTDGTGMLQHSVAGIADRDHGYCIDDNARALMLMAIADDLDDSIRNQLSSTYASFVQHAWNAEKSLFRNFMAFDRSWLETVGSEDSNGRTVWALGTAAAGLPMAAMRQWAIRQYDICINRVARLQSPRTQAFAMLGAAEMLSVMPEHESSRRILEDGAKTLSALLASSRRPDWTWFEIMLSYDNTRLPEALIRAGMVLQNQAYITDGLATLEWVTAQTCAPGPQFRPVGTDSFGEPFAPPALFDQQPLEAWAMIDACYFAYQASGDEMWIERATTARNWFLGANVLGKPLVDAISGECHDGLTPLGVNLNHGAESILSWQFAKRRYDKLISIRLSGEQDKPAPARAA